jgi:hypothetical protein
MAVTTHLPTKLLQAQGIGTANQAVNLSSGTAGAFKIMAVKAGAGLPSLISSGIQFVSDLIAVNPEDVSGAWPRTALTGITWAVDGSVNTSFDWSFSTITFAQNASDDGLTRYLAIYSEGGGTDATRPLVAIIDPGTTLSVLAGSLTIASPTGGLIQFQGGG